MICLKPTAKNIKKVREIIKNGGVIIYPTDTLYGLGADIFNKKAVKRIFKIKKRSQGKPISVMVAKISDIKKLAYLNPQQEKIAKRYLPGPYTILLKKKKNIPDYLTAGSQKVGIRIPKSKICQKLAKDLPITTTSANISGKKNLTLKQIIKQFKEVDLILRGPAGSGQPSVIIDLTVFPPQKLKRCGG